MQLCECEIRLGGNLGTTVIRKSRKAEDDPNGLDVGLVTPAEIVILKEIHGQDAVINVKPVKQDKRPHEAEWARLEAHYGRTPDGLTDAGNGNLLQRLFPGAIKKLPVSLKDIGLGHLANPLREQPENEEADNGEEAVEA